MGRRDSLERRLDQALARGVCLHASDDAERQRLRRMVRRGIVSSPVRGQFVRTAAWTALNPRARALVLIRSLAILHPDWVFCGVSAAIVHGLSVSFHLLGQVHIAVPRSRHGRSTRVVARHAIGKVPVVRVDGIRVTSLPRTVVDCLRHTSFAEGLVIADSSLQATRMSTGPFCELLGRVGRGLRGIRHALSTISWADARSESGGESLARALMVELGYQVPELQPCVSSALGDGHVYRPDFTWRLPTGTVYGEFDGRAKYVDPAMTRGRNALDVLADERIRESRLAASGRVMRLSYADLRPERLARVLDAFGIPRERPRALLDLRPPSLRDARDRGSRTRRDPRARTGKPRRRDGAPAAVAHAAERPERRLATK
ncbi:MAG: hypothetical protein SOH58_05460 [Olsenella sp.]|jgi:hypothetical protein